MDSHNPGGGKTVTGVTPKLYIKDEGTTYTTGEAYNGLWSMGTRFDPSGYGNIGHWKLLERKGRVAFNARSRGNNDLISQGVFWSTDSVGTYLSFKLPDDGPLPNASVNHYIMAGTGANFNEQVQWDQFLTTPGFNSMLGVGGPRKIRYHFDMWADFRRAPENNGDIQTLFYLHENGQHETIIFPTPSDISRRGLRFCIEKVSGTVYLSLYIKDSSSGFHPVRSSVAANKLFPKGFNNPGGLHHIGFLIDVDVQDSGNPVFSNPSVESPEGFWVDGSQAMADSGSTVDWDKGLMDFDVNPFIGCEIDATGSYFQADKNQETPAFVNHFLGKIYAIQLNSIGDPGTVNFKRLKTIYNLQFDIPRGPSYIDLSDKFEYGGRNLLQEISDIQQVVDDEKGNFYVTVQNIKAKN